MNSSSDRKLVTSGQAWLGEMPSDWQLKRAGALFQQRREKCSDKEFPPLSVTKKGIVPQLDTAAKTDDGDNRKKVIKGDFVINSRSDRKGSSGLSRLTGSVSLINTVLIPKGLDGYFTHHLLRCEAFQEEYYRWGKGIVADLWSTNFSEFRSISMPVPGLYEQRQIAAYLNRETAKIDRLIAKQKRLIELLQEKRQAVISKSVTKGLDPNVKMRDSGVEWLGEVPIHWKVGQIGQYAELFSGSTPSRDTPEFWAGGTIPWIKTGEVRYDTIFDSEEYITEEALASTSLKVAPAGTLLMAMYGQGVTRGRVALLGVAATFNQACVAIAPQRAVSSKYLLYYFMAAYHAVRDGGNETSQMNLNAELVGKIRFTLPPDSEQREIIYFLEKTLTKHDLLLDKAKQSIEFLKEHRQALISAAVTGKIDVRSLVTDEEVAALDAEPTDTPELDTEEDASYTTEEEQG